MEGGVGHVVGDEVGEVLGYRRSCVIGNDAKKVINISHESVEAVSSVRMA